MTTTFERDENSIRQLDPAAGGATFSENPDGIVASYSG
jgi:hypothetical protein